MTISIDFHSSAHGEYSHEISDRQTERGLRYASLHIKDPMGESARLYFRDLDQLHDFLQQMYEHAARLLNERAAV